MGCILFRQMVIPVSESMPILEIKTSYSFFIYGDEKSIIKRTIQYILDRIDNLMITFHAKRDDVI
jgi:hypothetical protein